MFQPPTPLQTLSIYNTSSYFFLLLLVFCEGSVVGGALIFLFKGGVGRFHHCNLNIRVINLGLEKSSSKLELKNAIVANLNRFKHEHCRL